MKKIWIFLLIVSNLSNAQEDTYYDNTNWKHLSTANYDFELPFTGKQQTSSLVVDIDNDGIPEIFLTERTSAPSVVMYKCEANKWERYIIDNEPLRIEAGSTAWDITGNGYKDIVFGGDSGSNQVWWWENPYPKLDKNIPWVRRIIKNDGSNKQHDQIFGDFTGKGQGELVFWNQGAKSLMIAEIPTDVKNVDFWNHRPIYQYSSDSQMEQIGHEAYPRWKGVNEHEGLFKIDIDGDGIDDIVGGGYWFKYIDDNNFQANIIDARYTFSRVIAGQFIGGGRPEVILVAGDGLAPIMLYEWVKGTWFGREILDGQRIENGHSLDVLDFNNDGCQDIFIAEMRLNGDNPDSKMSILFGDGKGNFKAHNIALGFGNHESRIIDLNGDGLYDIVGKPYNWEVPRLDIWINKGNKLNLRRF
ncbi:protein containing repeat domain [Bacteroidales bacterium 6E]|nr:protein containing repeat domain [Bacteroidales bacterium 6E]